MVRSIRYCSVILLRSSLSILFLLFFGGCASSATPSPQPTNTTAKTTPTAVINSEKWIEVVLDEQTAYLWQGDQLQASLPIASGIGNSATTTTYTGEYEVESMYPGPEQTAPGVYVRDIVIFDWEHGNGFHSLPMDAKGNILDSTIGRPASAGCIRVAESAILYDFTELGMKVLIH